MRDDDVATTIRARNEDLGKYFFCGDRITKVFFSTREREGWCVWRNALVMVCERLCEREAEYSQPANQPTRFPQPWKRLRDEAYSHAYGVLSRSAGYWEQAADVRGIFTRRNIRTRHLRLEMEMGQIR